MAVAPYRPVPATVTEAVHLANQIAYGFAKHTDDGYWDKLGYLKDPPYFWDRMCGWQAEGGPDRAPYGAWSGSLDGSVPPKAWNLPGNAGDVDPPPAEGAVALTLRAILERLDAQDRVRDALIAEARAALRAVKAPTYTGTIGGKVVTLKPVKPRDADL